MDDSIGGQKQAVRFSTNHHYSLGLFRPFAHKEPLKTGPWRPTSFNAALCVRPTDGACKTCQRSITVVHAAAETRIYCAHTVAERIMKLKAAITQTAVSQKWADCMKDAAAKVRDDNAAVGTFWGKAPVFG